MPGKTSKLAVTALAAAAFLAGAFFADVKPPQASAQAAPASTLPPIFQVGNTVTFGAQGARAHILQVHGDWIYVEQPPMGGFQTTGPGADNELDRYWIFVPSFENSWRIADLP